MGKTKYGRKCSKTDGQTKRGRTDDISYKVAALWKKTHQNEPDRFFRFIGFNWWVCLVTPSTQDGPLWTQRVTSLLRVSGAATQRFPPLGKE